MAIAIGLITVLFSCKKDDLKNQTNNSQVQKMYAIDGGINQINFTYQDEKLAYNVKTVNEETDEYLVIDGKDNSRIKEIIQSNPDGVFYFESENNITFFNNPSEFFLMVPYAAKTTSGASSTSTCQGEAHVRTTFYKHKNFNTVLDQKIALGGIVNSSLGTISAYQNYYDFNGYLRATNSSNVNAAAAGFSVPWVGNNNNDNISSIKIETVGNTYQPTSSYLHGRSLSGFQDVKGSFVVVWWEHANYSGYALAMGLNSCNNIRQHSNLKNAALSFWYTWNDKISSYIGYYSPEELKQNP